MNKQKYLCERFLRLNGFKKYICEEIAYFQKEGLPEINFCDDEIVFIGEIGDFMHMEYNFYTLLGFMIHFDFVNTRYNWIREDKRSIKNG